MERDRPRRLLKEKTDPLLAARIVDTLEGIFACRRLIGTIALSNGFLNTIEGLYEIALEGVEVGLELLEIELKRVKELSPKINSAALLKLARDPFVPDYFKDVGRIANLWNVMLDRGELDPDSRNRMRAFGIGIEEVRFLSSGYRTLNPNRSFA